MREMSLIRALLLAIGYVLSFLALTALAIVAWLAMTRGWRADWNFVWLIPPNVGRSYIALMLLPPALFLLAWVAARVPR